MTISSFTQMSAGICSLSEIKWKPHPGPMQAHISADFFLLNLVIFLLKDNSFTEFCCFLSNLNMDQPSVQFSSVIQSCPTLCDLMNRSTPGLPVHQPQVHTYPFPFEPPSHLPHHPTPLGLYRAPVWVSWVVQQIPIGSWFYIWWCKFPCYSLNTSHPLPMSISLFSMSVSPLLSCK